MVTDAIFNALATFFAAVLALLPSWSPPTIPTATCDDPATGAPLANLGCKAQDMGAYVHYLHRWVDTSALASVLTIVLAVYIAVAAARLVIFVYDKFPGKAS